MKTLIMDARYLVERLLKTQLVCATMALFLVHVHTASVLEGSNNFTVSQGDAVILACKIDDVDDSLGQAVVWENGRPNPTISHGRVIVREEKKNRFSIVGNATNGEYNLKIMPVLAEDNGRYSCSVFRGDPESSASAYLTVKYPPSNKYPVCYPLENKLQFTEIEMLSIVCKTGISDPPANVTWIDSNDREINDTSITLIGEEYVVTHKEIIYNYHDGATFTCSVSHPLWSEAHNCSLGPLFILYRPLTMVSVQMTTTDVELKCIATGNPSKFSYEWTVYLGNQTAPHADFERQDVTSRTDTLVLERSKYFSSELVIECAARNTQGVGRSNATILLSSSHCRGGKTKLVDICRTISLPTICVLVIVIFLSWIAITLLIIKVRNLTKTTAPEVSNVSSRVEMKRNVNNGVYVTLTESIDNLERI